MKNWWIFTIFYFLATIFMVFKLNNDIFVTDKNGTIIIFLIMYFVLFLGYIIFKKIKERKNKNMDKLFNE